MTDSDFSRFFYDATDEDKIALLREVVEQANADQRELLKTVDKSLFTGSTPVVH